jgi:hypothetical protein
MIFTIACVTTLMVTTPMGKLHVITPCLDHLSRLDSVNDADYSAVHLSVDSTDRVRLAMSASGMVYSCNGSQCTFLHNLPSMNVHQAAGLLHVVAQVSDIRTGWTIQ